MERSEYMKDNSFFYEFKQSYASLKQGLSNRFWRLMGLLFLIALPVALVNGYSSGRLAESIFSSMRLQIPHRAVLRNFCSPL